MPANPEMIKSPCPSPSPESVALVNGAYRLRTSEGELDLMPDGSVFDPLSQTLLVADVHVGKAEIFRRLGVPVPAMTSSQTLDRLSTSIAACRPRAVVVLGDLIHGRLPAEHPVFDSLAAWREQHAALDVQLLRGNHDHHAGALPARCRIGVWPAGQKLGGWQLCHEPDEVVAGQGMALCGHLHPVIYLRHGADAARVRCFWLQRGLLLTLPAFGAFTGGQVISPDRADQVFILDGRGVRALPDGWANKGRKRSFRRVGASKSG